MKNATNPKEVLVTVAKVIAGFIVILVVGFAAGMLCEVVFSRNENSRSTEGLRIEEVNLVQRANTVEGSLGASSKQPSHLSDSENGAKKSSSRGGTEHTEKRQNSPIGPQASPPKSPVLVGNASISTPALDDQMTSNETRSASSGTQPQGGGVAISVAKQAMNGSVQPHVVDPHAPGNSMKFAGQDIAVDQVAGNPSGGLSLDATFTPSAENQTASDDKTSSVANSTSSTLDRRAYFGLSYQDFLFRNRWGWKAFDDARSAAKGIAGGQ